MDERVLSLFSSKPTALYYQNLRSVSDIVVNQGGTSSGKSYSIIMVLFTMAMANAGYRITVVGATVPKIRKDVLQIAQDMVATSPIVRRYISSFNRQYSVYTFTNGSFIEFCSYETRESAKGAKRDIVYINEATSIDYWVFWELNIRCQVRMFIDYNPTVRFWVHDKVIGRSEYGSVEVIRSWHIHNPYLPDKVRARIEGIEDKELWKVYARGLTGRLHGTVFDWAGCVVPMEGVEEVIWGIDWGYSVDPTAVTKVYCMKDGSFVVQELFYTPLGSVNKDFDKMDYLVSVLRSFGYSSESIYCDHDKELGMQLRDRGIDVEAAEKGNGAELNRVLYVKQKKVMYTVESANLKVELLRYTFVDVEGNMSNKIKKGGAHLIDSATMAIYSHRYRSKRYLEESKSEVYKSYDEV